MTDTLMLADLAGVEEQKHSAVKTAGLVLGIVAAVYAVALAIALSTWGPGT